MPQFLCNQSFKASLPVRSIEQSLAIAIQENKLNSLIYVVPTGRLVRFLKNELTREYFKIHKKPIFNPNIYTLQSFIASCFDFLPNKNRYRIISESYQLALFEEAVKSADLQFFAGKEGKVSITTISRLAKLIYGLKEDGISPADIEKDLSSENPNLDKARLKDVYSIFIEYQKLLAERFLDAPELLNKTIEYFSSGQSIDKRFPNNPKILFNGFSQFKPPEIKFISLFAKSSTPFAIQIDYSPDNGPLFSNLEDTIVAIKDAGFSLFEMEGQGNEKNIDAVSNSMFLRQNLFSGSKAKESKEFSKFTKIFSCQDKEQEVKAICKLVKELAINEKVELKDICILARKPEEYSSLFREYFADYKIAGNISDRFNLSESAIVTAIFSLLNIINLGYKRKDIHSALQSNFLNFNCNGEQDEIDINNMLSTAEQLRISGGNFYKGEYIWKTFLENRIKFLSDTILEAKTTGQFDQTEIENKQRELKKVQKALEDFLKIHSLLPKIKGKISPKEFNLIIKKEIIEKFGIRKIISNYLKELLAENNCKENQFEQAYKIEQLEKESRSFTAFLNLLDEMTAILQERKAREQFDFFELSERLKIAVQGAKYQIAEKHGSGVTVTSIEQIRGIPYKINILCGAVEKSFPLSYNVETFLGKELPDTKTRHIRSERMLFYQFLSNYSSALDSGEKQIYIFYPKQSEQELQVPSPFIDKLFKITTLEEDACFFDLTQQNSSAESNLPKWLNAIAGKRELAEFLGKKAYSDLSGNHFELGSDLIDFKDNYSYLQYYYSALSETQNSILEKISQAFIEKVNDLKKNTFSITQIETYRDCPYKYFSKYLLNFKEVQKYEETLSALERGNIIHSILYSFFKRIQKEQLESKETEILGEIKDWSKEIAAQVQLKREKFSFYKEILEDIAKKVFDASISDTPLQKLSQDIFFGSGKRPGYLEIWLNNEIENQEQSCGFLPSLFEISFNLPRIKNSLDISLDEELKISGKIDRIDICTDGSFAKFLVADYKSSPHLPNTKAVVKGKSFQVPLYILAAKKIFNDYYGLASESEGGVYYIFFPKSKEKQEAYQYSKYLLMNKEQALVQSKGLERTRDLLKSEEEAEQILELSLFFAKDIVKNISLGLYPVEPVDDNVCKYCSYSALCRIKEKHLIFEEEDESSE